MGKNYIQIDLPLGSSVEQAVNTLLSYREKAKLAVVKFNGVTLYSDTVTMDSAYKEIVGMTKAEFDEYLKKRKGTIV